jgi:hypothetical protein
MGKAQMRLLIIAFTAGMSTGADAETGGSNHLVAVLPLTAPKLDKDLRDTLEEDIRTVAGNYLSPRGYTILTGDNTLELMADNAVDASKVCDATCALKAAREMKANLFISGSATKAEGEYIAFVRLFEAKGGRQLGSVKLEGAKVKELREQFETKAAELFQRVEGLAGTGEVAVATTTTTAPPEVAPSGPRVKKSQVTAAVGTLTISAKPKDVVRVDLVDPDGKKSATGASYENKQAKPGTWRLVARASGYEEQEQTVEVPPDDVTLVKIELKPFGGLKVTGTPSGAAVSVSGPGGFHDDGGLPWEADGLKSGTYQVKVTRAGYGAAEETAEVKPGETATVRVALQKSMVSAGGGGGATKVEPKSGLTFIHLPGGTFHYGCEPQDTQCFDTEKPGKSVTGQPMWMGKTTVTVAAYAKCVSAGACTAAGARERESPDQLHRLESGDGLLSVDRRTAADSGGVGVRGEGWREPHLPVGQ